MPGLDFRPGDIRSQDLKSNRSLTLLTPHLSWLLALVWWWWSFSAFIEIIRQLSVVAGSCLTFLTRWLPTTILTTLATETLWSLKPTPLTSDCSGVWGRPAPLFPLLRLREARHLRLALDGEAVPVWSLGRNLQLLHPPPRRPHHPGQDQAVQGEEDRDMILGAEIRI